MTARVFSVKAVRHRRHGNPCNSCPGALRYTTHGRVFTVRTGHGKDTFPITVRKQPGRRYGPAPKARAA